MTVPRSEQFRSRVTAGKMGKINDGMGWGGTGWRNGNGTLSDMSTGQRGRTTGVQVHAKQITGRGKKRERAISRVSLGSSRQYEAFPLAIEAWTHWIIKAARHV